jgi:hypothetical protein
MQLFYVVQPSRAQIEEAPKFDNFQIETEPSSQTRDVHADRSSPNDYFFLSIINIIACNFVIGGVALVFSILSRNQLRKSNKSEAVKFSKRSLVFNCIALCVGLVTWVVCSVVFALKIASYMKTAHS